MNAKYWLAATLLGFTIGAHASGGSPAEEDSTTENSGTVEYSGLAWQRRALDLERDLDKSAPLRQATFVGTHNSYNAAAYADATRYLDPNQNQSIRAQLDMGARFLEFDVHMTNKFDTHGSPWAWEWTSNDQLLLCHGQDNHLGCSSADRYFRDGLREVRDFLAANPDEVVLLYIEDHMDGEYQKASNILDNTVGQYLYRADQHGSGCQGVPGNLSKQDILDSNANLVVITGGGCSGHASYDARVFGQGFNTRNTANAAQCDGLSRSGHDSAFVRYYEDRTNLSAAFGNPGEPITTGNIGQLLACGANVIGLDKLDEDDGRLESAIWSWGANEPNNYNGAEDCAESRNDGRFNDVGCGAIRQFACRQPGTHNWYVTQGSGQWSQGNTVCNSETGGSHQFAVPGNAYENSQLIDAKSASGATRVWINYNDQASEGDWQGHTAP
ncbi:MAG: phosphatidylinositol-specific phospholipase C domain-containing protein [Pseudomonadota bacterium]